MTNRTFSYPCVPRVTASLARGRTKSLSPIARTKTPSVGKSPIHDFGLSPFGGSPLLQQLGTRTSYVAKNAKYCHSEARCGPRNLSALWFQTKRDSSRVRNDDSPGFFHTRGGRSPTNGSDPARSSAAFDPRRTAHPQMPQMRERTPPRRPRKHGAPFLGGPRSVQKSSFPQWSGEPK